MICAFCAFLWRKLPRRNLTLLLTMWHSHGCATERLITSSVSTPDCDRVNPARAGARTLSPQTHTGWTDDLPVGRRVAIANAVLRLVAGNAADNARHSAAAVINPNLVSERDVIQRVV